MSKKLLILFVIFVVIIQSTLIASAATVQVENKGDNKYKSVRLTPELYHITNKDLTDILIKDDKGNIVPYFINSYYEKDYDESNIYDLTLINSYLKKEEFYFDYKLENIPSSDVMATAIVAESNNVNFAKDVEIFGSHDNINWQKIKEDTLYNVDNKSKTEITFDEPKKFTYYRFKLSNNFEKISFDKVYLEYNVTQKETSYFIETIKPKFNVSQQGTNTKIEIEELKNLKLAELTIVSDSMFKRMIVTPFADKQIYNLNFGNDNYTDTTVPMNWQIPEEDILTVTILNNDDKPIDINELIVKYYADELIFDGSGSDFFEIKIDKSDDKLAPNYDIANYQDLALKQEKDALEVGKITYDKEAETSIEYDYKLIFNIVIVVVGVLLGFIILSKIKKS